MNLSEPFIRRPVMTTLVMLAILDFLVKEPRKFSRRANVQSAGLAETSPTDPAASM